MAGSESHVELVEKIDKLAITVAELHSQLILTVAELNGKVDLNHKDIERQLDNKFELLTQSLLTSNKELCTSIIGLTTQSDINKVGIAAGKVNSINSRNLTINAVVASVTGVVTVLITKLLS